jgi:hypothetical protein
MNNPSANTIIRFRLQYGIQTIDLPFYSRQLSRALENPFAATSPGLSPASAWCPEIYPSPFAASGGPSRHLVGGALPDLLHTRNSRAAKRRQANSPKLTSAASEKVVEVLNCNADLHILLPAYRDLWRGNRYFKYGGCRRRGRARRRRLTPYERLSCWLARCTQNPLSTRSPARSRWGPSLGRPELALETVNS